MSFARDYLAQLEAFAAKGALPRIRALHLPPIEAAGSKEGEFCAVELEGGALGLSYVLLDDTLGRLRDGQDASGLAGVAAMTVARAYVEGVGVQRTLGFAVANAITRHLFDLSGFVPPDSADAIGGLAPTAGERIGMIGFFRPLAERIVATGAELVVVELNPALAGPQAGFYVTTDAGVLRDCDKVLSTSTILLNDTLERMLSLCGRARRIALIGPSAGCLPDALFSRGVSSLGGSWVTDRDGFVDALTRGDGWSRYARKCAIAPADWPGFASLLARL
ncbi:Rossmann-like domain-containing protein [Denitromonas iodatirespirans]|uniref:Putative heavy-metal chelation domain-containing protein n=1 Tax=Denitromonas iodatirespirans TaxID=2795389 RepID=A0A944D8P1_DENI1|nr:DUF364 domain-containing protein [Denitromonas iodatirespirans]MBT0960657.1 hypothetical protein [Denitromonas iodatirespirans]